jgi:predicted lipid-binding transport protein (Tim44 family)
MIVHAFATGDRESLKPLLDKDVYASFDSVIAAREGMGHKTEFTLVSQREAEFADAALRDRIAEVTVKFVSEIISVTRDAAGAVVDGVAGAVREVTDIWTFARDTRSSDPNWKLVATGGA